MKKLILLLLIFSGCSTADKFEHLNKISAPLNGRYFALDREIVIDSPSFTWTKYVETGSEEVLEKQKFQTEDFFYLSTKSENQVITQSYLLTIKDTVGISSTHSYIVKRDFHNPDKVISINLYLAGPHASESLYIFVE